MTEPTRPCSTCGMPCTPGEYHPYAACLMFKACLDSETVRANLEAVRCTSPVVAGEPYAYAVYFPDQPCEELVHDLDDLCDDLTNREHVITRLYTTPQPTQAQAGAVPLTRERVKAILTECGYDGASAQHRADFINGLRHGEAAHGIKGGQHG